MKRSGGERRKGSARRMWPKVALSLALCVGVLAVGAFSQGTGGRGKMTKKPKETQKTLITFGAYANAFRVTASADPDKAVKTFNEGVEAPTKPNIQAALAAALDDLGAYSFMELFREALEESNNAVTGAFGNLPSASMTDPDALALKGVDEDSVLEKLAAALETVGMPTAELESSNTKSSKSWVCGWNDPVSEGEGAGGSYGGSKSKKSKESKSSKSKSKTGKTNKSGKTEVSFHKVIFDDNMI